MGTRNRIFRYTTRIQESAEKWVYGKLDKVFLHFLPKFLHNRWFFKVSQRAFGSIYLLHFQDMKPGFWVLDLTLSVSISFLFLHFFWESMPMWIGKKPLTSSVSFRVGDLVKWLLWPSVREKCSSYYYHKLSVSSHTLSSFGLINFWLCLQNVSVRIWFINIMRMHLLITQISPPSWIVHFMHSRFNF